MRTFSTFFAPILAASYVSAHGIIVGVSINGKQYTGNDPGSGGGPSVIRQVSTPFPNYGATNPALTCGPNAEVASLVADAMPGDTMTFKWGAGDSNNDKWPHNIGPMLTYLADCGGDCTQYTADASTQWFKINQQGKSDDTTWVQQELFNGGVATVNLPSTLAPGQYLVRHEIIALHIATTEGKAEFYPGCTQINVGGSQTGKPASNELVNLPGAYKDTDPGIFDPDVFSSQDYTPLFPGPPVAAFVTAGGTPAASNSGSSSANPTSTSTSAQPANPTKTGAAKSGTCKLKRRQQAVSAREVVGTVQRRHGSRIMRRFGFGSSH